MPSKPQVEKTLEKNTIFADFEPNQKNVSIEQTAIKKSPDRFDPNPLGFRFEGTFDKKKYLPDSRTFLCTGPSGRLRRA